MEIARFVIFHFTLKEGLAKENLSHNYKVCVLSRCQKTRQDMQANSYNTSSNTDWLKVHISPLFVLSKYNHILWLDVLGPCPVHGQ